MVKISMVFASMLALSFNLSHSASAINPAGEQVTKRTTTPQRRVTTPPSTPRSTHCPSQKKAYAQAKMPQRQRQ